MKKFFMEKNNINHKCSALFLRIVQWVLTLSCQYVVSILACVYAVPLACAFIASATGATINSALISVLTLWVFPSIFATLIILVVTLIICRFIYRKFKNIFDKKIAKQNVISA